MLDKSDKKFIKDEIETAVGQLVGAMTAGFQEVDKRFQGVEEELASIKSDVGYTKRRLTDLETDAPSNAEFQGHEKRIGRLEKAVFTS